MTLVTIDLGDVAGGHDPDDHVIIRAEAFRESQGGGITSTAEVVIPLVDGVGQAEVEPGPVVVAFRCRAVADTREKRGVVPGEGPVGIEKVLENAFEYLPPVVNHALETIKGAVAAEVDAIKWKRGMLPRDITNLADAEDGDWIVASASHATELGLPSPLISRISKHSFGTAIFYLVTTGGANPRIWLRYGNTGEWQRLANLDDIPAPWWRGTSQIQAGETLESIAVGEYTLWSASHATSLGLPTATQGELVKRAFGNTTTYTWTAFFPDGFQEWKRRITTTGGDTGWVDVSGSGDDPGMEVTPAGMKLVPLALSLGQGATTASGGAMSGGFRVPIRYNVPITRWRVCFTNRNPRYGTTRNAQSVVSSVVVGAHTDGAYSSAPSTVATNLAVSSNGAVSRTPWQTIPIGDGRDMAISYRYATSGPEAPPLLVGGGWDLGTSSPSTLNPSRTRVIRLPFDMWIEAETYSTTPVIAGFGDSITCGVGATLPVFDSWPNVYARTVGALPMHYSTSGDTFENWGLDEKAYKVSRWDHLARPDAVLWAMGTNDMASSRTFAQHQANTQKMVEIIRERWSPNLYLSTIMPRNSEAAEIKSMRDQWNTWASLQPEFRDTFDFATAVRDPATGGILPVYNADGLHLSSAGSAAQAAAITRPIANHVVSGLQAADMALGQRIDAEKWWRGALGSADNLDTLYGSSSQGLYRITPAVGGGPGLSGWVEITYDSNSARTRQVFTSSSPSDAVSLERKRSGGVWREWAPVTWSGVVVHSGNADDLIAPHAYAINTTGLANLPVATLGSLQTLPSGSGASTLTQIFVSSEPVPRMWTRTRRSSVWGQWVRWATHQDVEDIATHLIDENQYVPPTLTMLSRETPLNGGAGVIQSFSTDGKVGYNALTAELRQTLDEGATWQPVRTFGGNYTEWTRMLPNGELMVSTSGTVGGVSGRRVWVSTGYRPETPTAATWEVVLTPAAPYVKFADWSISITDEMILLAEYGPKSGMVWGSGTDIIPEGQNARYVYQSLDNGKTWSTIFDLNQFLLSNGRPNADRQHLHGVAWDKWWQRIWVSFGDASGDGTNGVLYSDDRGTTWKTAYWTHTHPSQGWQVVGIQPMKDCVLFAGDMTPSGVIRLDRAQGKNSFVFETGWDFSDTDKHLCHVITYQDGPMGEIALFAFAREGSASPSFILGTRDGFAFEVLWQETGASLPGIRSVAGPSAQGTIIAAVNSASGWLEVRGTLTAHGTPLVADPTISLGQRIDEKADRSAVEAADVALGQRIDGKADTAHTHTSTGITDAVSTIPSSPNRLVKTNADGKLFITTSSITGLGDPTNKAYVDDADAALGRRVDLLFPSSILAGQVLKWDGTKFIPSWLGQHPTNYHDTY